MSIVRILAALEHFAGALGAFKKSVDSIGVRIVPNKWKMATDAAESAATLLKRVGACAPPDIKDGARADLFDVLDDLDEAEQHLVRAFAVVAEPNVIVEATLSMSQAFADRVKNDISVIAAAEASVRKEMNLLSEALAAAGTAPSVPEIVEAYEAKQRGGLSTDLYVARLKNTAGASQLLEKTKNSVLGGGKEPRGDLVFAIRPGGADVRYDYAPLVSAAAGPPASTVTGLNFKLVQRLRTIGAKVGEAKVGEAKVGEAKVGEADESKAKASEAKADESKAKASEAKADESKTVVVPARLIAYNANVSAVIFASLEGIAPPAETLKAYADKTAELALQCDQDTLIKNMRSAFYAYYADRFGESHPTGMRDFLAFAIPGGSVDPGSKEAEEADKPENSIVPFETSYIVSAVAKSMFEVLDRQILRARMSAPSAKISYDVGRSEALLAHATQSVAAARAISRRLRDALLAAAARPPSPLTRQSLLKFWDAAVAAAVARDATPALAPTLAVMFGL